MSNKTKLIISALLAGFAANAFAASNAPVVTLGGSIDTQFGHKTEKYPFDSTLKISQLPNNDEDLILTSTRLSRWGIVNDTKVHIKVDGTGHGFRYGGLINLNTDTSQSKENESSVAHQTMMYVESCLGRFEAGSYTGAYDAMKVNGASVARATGGIDGDWKYWVNTDVDRPATPSNGTGLTTLAFAPSLPTAFDKSYEANSSKITYYTPTYHGFRAGVTFVPDTDQHGTITNLKGLTKSYTTFVFPGHPNPGNLGSPNNTNSYTTVFQGGVAFKHRFSNKVGFKLAALGEVGDAKKYLAGTNTVDRHDLRAYEIGAKVNYMGFGVAGSYGDWGKTGLAKTVTTVAGVVTPVSNAKATHYWTVGLNYVHHCYGLSAGYLSSEGGGFGLVSGAGAGLLGTNPRYDSRKGKAQVYSFGADYKAAPGLMPYLEVSSFRLNDKTDTATGKNSGTVVLVGSKLTF